MDLPAYCRPTTHAAFARALDDVDSTDGLFRAAFAISLHDRPEGRFDQAEAIIADLAGTVRSRVRSTASEAILAHFHDVMFDVVGFRGNAENYYDPGNSYLGQVLSSRRGIPITLVLVYKLIAERLGLTVHGINAPGHFLAGVELADSPQCNTANAGDAMMYVDPFYGGGILSEPEVFQRISDATGRPISPSTAVLARATHREWLMRMLNNLQAIFARAGRQRDLYAMQELQQLL